MTSITDTDLAELRALLFGEGTYGRYGAPEPALLGDLAPALPRSMLEKAIQTISEIGVIGLADRGRTLAKLLAELPEQGSDALLAKSVILHPEVVSQLPPPLVPRALTAVRSPEFTDHGYGRADALIALAGRLPKKEARGILLDSALTAAADASKGGYSAKNDFLALAEHQIAPIPNKAARKLLACANAVSRDEELVRLLCSLIPALRDPLRTEASDQAEVAAQALHNDPASMARALLLIAPHLPGWLQLKALRDALREARGLDLEHSSRMELLSELSLRLPGAAGDGALVEAMAPYTQGVYVSTGEEALLKCFADLASRGDATLEPGLHERVPALMPQGRVPIELAPFLSEPQLAMAVEGIPDLNLGQSSWFDSDKQAQALAKAIPYLAESLLSRLITIAADSAHYEDVRAHILIALAPALSQPLALKALEITRGLDEKWWRWRMLESLEPRLPKREQAEVADELESVSSRRLCALMSTQPEEVQTTLVREMIDAISEHYGGAPPPTMARPPDTAAAEPIEQEPPTPSERSVTTHPNLKGENHAYVAKPYEFTVKLSDQPQADGTYVSAPPVDVPTEEGEVVKKIEVWLTAPDFALNSAGEAQGWVREINFYPETAASSAITYTLCARNRFEERYFSTLRIQFVLNGQVLGYAARRVEVLANESVIATPPSDFPPAHGYPFDERGEARVPPVPTPVRMVPDLPSVTGVHLTVKISETDGGKPLLWEIVSPYLKSNDFPESGYKCPNLGAEEFVKNYLAPFGMPGDWRYRHMNEHGCLQDQSINNLYGILLNLRRKAPRPFWVLYELALERHREQGGTAEDFTVLFLTSDTHVPWELMPVSEQAEQGGRPELLGSAHRVGRWLLDVGDPIPETELDLHGFTVVAPTYKNKPLPKAQEEREFIEKSGNYKPCILAGFPDTFFKFMATGQPTGGTGILHFAGHGDCCSDLTRCNWLLLSDDQEDSYDVFSADTENANCLGRLRAVVAFFNACNVGRDAPGPLGSNGGWGRALLRQKYKAYVGPLWSVYDEHALEICQLFYSLAVDDGLPLGEVMRRIRARFSEDNRLFTYLAYLYLGHPLAKIAYTPFQGDEACQKSN